jgi:hypothetical protein
MTDVLRPEPGTLYSVLWCELGATPLVMALPWSDTRAGGARSPVQIAYGNLVSNVLEDAFYPIAITEAPGRALDSRRKYLMRFLTDEAPPADAFWSLTTHKDRRTADAPNDRYAISHNDPLTLNTDGSVDLFVQRQIPDLTPPWNWLPSPRNGGFSLTMRVYWPRSSAPDAAWKPPTLEEID